MKKKEYLYRLNGNFSESNNVLADKWLRVITNASNPRVENNRQYWTPLLSNTDSTSIYQRINLIPGNIYFLKYIGKNIGNVLTDNTTRW